MLWGNNNTENTQIDLIDERYYVPYVYRAFRDLIKTKVANLVTLNKPLKSEHWLEISELKEWILDNITQIKLKDPELAETFEQALKSLNMWLILWNINAWSDAWDMVTIQHPSLSIVTSASMIPAWAHKLFTLNPRLKKLQSELEAIWIKADSIHQASMLGEWMEAVDFVFEVLLKTWLQFIPQPIKNFIPYAELLVALWTLQQLHNALISMYNSSHHVLSLYKPQGEKKRLLN